MSTPHGGATSVRIGEGFRSKLPYFLFLFFRDLPFVASLFVWMIYSNAQRNRTHTHKIPLPTDLYFSFLHSFFFHSFLFCFCFCYFRLCRPLFVMDRCGCMKCHTTNRFFSSCFFSPNSTPISNWWFTLADQRGLVVWLFGFGCSFLSFLTDNSNRVATDCVNHIANVSFYVSLFFFVFFLLVCFLARRLSDTLTASLGRGGHWRDECCVNGLFFFFSHPALPKVL